MTNIIRFTGRPVIEPEPPQGIDDIEAAKLYDFRGEWGRAAPKLKSLGFDLSAILAHDVTLAEIGQGIAIASYLKRDTQAAYALLDLLKCCIERGYDTRTLAKVEELDPGYIGYVWTMDYQVLINAASYVRHRYHDLVDYRLSRVVLFPNSGQFV